MIQSGAADSRKFLQRSLEAGLVITGGGLSGVCAAITAARMGVSVILVQDRPVLGGNASSEVRLWVLGASSHMGNNNRWAREGGVIDELLVENTYCNPEGNPIIFDAIILDKVVSETNITLLLNTAVYEVYKDGDRIRSLKAYCSQNQTEYLLQAPFFLDCSGDGVVGFLSGAAFRMGAESAAEFGEQFAPEKEYGELLGHSLYFYSKDTGRPVRYTAPSFALKDITKIPRYRSFNARDQGCKLWWIEYGGRLDTVRDTETIKWELWKVVYGVWDYIKNSGNFPEADTMTLEWVGMIPGKRESRRFEGDYMLVQQDIVGQRRFDDAVAFGGWSIDLHPADGVFSEKPGCNQWHSKGIYEVPYRCLYSRNVTNLFFGGRLISASHVAFGSSRVMATGAYLAQAAAVAAIHCSEQGLAPRELLETSRMTALRHTLQKAGQHIPGRPLHDPRDLIHTATVRSSSSLVFRGFEPFGNYLPITISAAQMLPVAAGPVPAMTITVRASEATRLTVTLRISSKSTNHTPDIVLEETGYDLQPGDNLLTLDFRAELPGAGYAFITFHKNPAVELPYSAQRITGILSVFNLVNEAVSNYGRQSPPPGIGMDEFEFWCPQRRPAGQNLALSLASGLDCFNVSQLTNGYGRPTDRPNAWVADPGDAHPSLEIAWQAPQTIREVILHFDTDFDHPMESVLMTHPEREMPFCVRNYRVLDDKGVVIHQYRDNYQTINRILLKQPVTTRSLRIEFDHPSPEVPAAVFQLLCYA